MSVVNSRIKGNSINWRSPALGTSIFKPYEIYQNLSQIRPGSNKYDIVFISCTSLQDFQTVCADLVPFLHLKSAIVVESTGYVNLEPFVQLSFPSMKDITICSIMNESDVRQIDGDNFTHILRNNDNRIYLGTSLTNSNISSTSNASFQKVYKLLQLVQQDSSNNISLLKSVVPKEFMTYQWKLALPRIVFNPLSIIFEAEVPSNLSNQILCKPLITGMINEIFKIIKKMDCKLVKGSENESNLFKNWCSSFPETSKNQNYLNSPAFFYDFYKQHELNIDLLLLQPILLADDHGIRTPYLENIYSTMCQYIKINDTEINSIFFTRRINSNVSKAKVNQINADHEHKLNELNLITNDLAKMESNKNQIDSYLKEKEILRVQVLEDINKQELNLRKLNINVDHQQQKLTQVLQRLEQLQLQEQEMTSNQAKLVQPSEQSSKEVPVLPQSGSNKTFRESVVPNDNLEDLTDIALYGASLASPVLNQNAQNGHTINREPDINGHGVSNRGLNMNGGEPVHGNGSAYPNGNIQLVNGDLPQHLHEKELELQKREQALINRELSLPNENSMNGYYDNEQHRQPQHPQQHSHQPQPQQYPQHPPALQLDTQQKGSNMPPNQQQYFNQRQYNNNHGYMPSPMDQQLPHGLPSNGLPPNALPPNLRVNSMNSNMNRYNMPPPQMMNGNPNQPNGYGAKSQRLSSFPTSAHNYQDLHQQQYAQNPPQQQYYNNMYQNGAPVEHMESRFKAQPRKQNRRSAFPQMNGDLSGLDMGGRGGMPMPGGPTNPSAAKANKHRSTMALNSNGNRTSPPQHKKSVSSYTILQNQGQNQPQGQPQGQAQNPSEPQQYNHAQPQQQYLQLPNGSNASSNSSNSVNTNDTPQTNDEGVQIQVPVVEPNAKPLGGISNPNKESEAKKKRGIFRKH